MGLSFGVLTTRIEGHAPLRPSRQSPAAELAAAGLTVTVVCLAAERSPGRSESVVTSAAEADAALARCDVVIVDHEFHGTADIDGMLVAALRGLRCPLIMCAPAASPAPTRHEYQLFNEMCRLADALVVTSAVAHRRLAAAYAGVPAAVVYIPSGPLRPASLLRDLPGAGAPTIIVCGPLGPERGLETVIDAMAALRPLDPRPRCLIVGPTDTVTLARDGEAYRHALMARTLDRGVASMVHITAEPPVPWETELRSGRTDLVLVACMHPEPRASLALAAARAAGTPVVALVSPGLSARAAEAGLGRLVPVGDPGMLAAVLWDLLTDPAVGAGPACRMTPSPTPAGIRMADRYGTLAAELLAIRRTPKAV